MSYTINGNNQEVFDRVVNHLRSQGGPAVDWQEGCQYKTYDGKKCAAGCLIPDELYNAIIEGKSWREVAEYLNITSECDQILIRELQKAHDQAIWLDDINVSLKHIADTFGLTFTPLTSWNVDSR